MHACKVLIIYSTIFMLNSSTVYMLPDQNSTITVVESSRNSSNSSRQKLHSEVLSRYGYICKMLYTNIFFNLLLNELLHSKYLEFVVHKTQLFIYQNTTGSITIFVALWSDQLDFLFVSSLFNSSARAILTYL